MEQLEQLRPGECSRALSAMCSSSWGRRWGHRYGTGSLGGRAGGGQSSHGNRGVSSPESQPEPGWSQVVRVSM